MNQQLESGAWPSFSSTWKALPSSACLLLKGPPSKKKKEAQQIWQGGLPGGPTWPSSAMSARTRSGKPKSATARSKPTRCSRRHSCCRRRCRHGSTGRTCGTSHNLRGTQRWELTTLAGISEQLTACWHGGAAMESVAACRAQTGGSSTPTGSAVIHTVGGLFLVRRKRALRGA